MTRTSTLGQITATLSYDIRYGRKRPPRKKKRTIANDESGWERATLHPSTPARAEVMGQLPRVSKQLRRNDRRIQAAM